MPILHKTISLDWLTAANACNLPQCREYFNRRGITELPLTADSILAAHSAGILSSNWLAKRVLSGDEYIEYEAEMKLAYAEFEKRMAPFLAGLIEKGNKK